MTYLDKLDEARYRRMIIYIHEGSGKYSMEYRITNDSELLISGEYDTLEEAAQEIYMREFVK